MLHIIFLILKIIGIILLVILGIAVLLVSTVLLCPVRYRITAKSDGTLDGIDTKVRMHWLLRFISAYALYRDENLIGRCAFYGKK